MSPEAAERTVTFLRQRHPLKTADCVAAETGLPAGTVRKWLALVSAPSFSACLALIVTYGPEFLAAALADPPGWIDTAAREARRLALRDELAALEARLRRTEADRGDP